ncbi:retrovirus-related pol polyprotein from transposon TNT 1-94 [Tanacetum coccineum]|uniref:Retrovirus-related pol polyprotein from transposon TNT 1-94 n=1 Tax=Tanacetum coccineum TaxID=301880 RepID=A0ABQ5BJI8_9ASTR
MFSCNSTGVVSSSSVSRPESKNTNLKKIVLLNTKSKSTSKDVKETQSSVTLVSNKCDTLNSNLFESNTHVLKVKTVNAMNDGSNHVCVLCGTYVFMISHDKCVARYALSSNSRVKRALFTSHVAAKSSKLGATLVISKSRFSFATPPKATNKVIQIFLWNVDSGCSKHMTGNLKQLRNYVEKFMGKVCLDNDHFAAITGYGDYVQGNLMICHVYYVESLEHNIFSVGQFCDGDLEVAFRSNTCYVQNLEGEDLLTGSRDSNLYTISISEMVASFLVCLMSKATPTKSCLWHQRLSHLNFGTINHLTKHDLVYGLQKFKYDKDHLCSTCEQGKSKKAILNHKLVPSTHFKLELIHMDLCGPMRVESINGKRYILVIVDDYSHYTWVYFLRKKDKAPEMIIKFITHIQRNMRVQILKVRSDNAEAIATAYFIQNNSLVHTRYNKTPYELIKGRKPNVQYFHVFKSLCYPTNNRDDLGKMKPKADIGPGFNCLNFQDSLEDSNVISSKEDLDNLFGPLYKEYYVTRTTKVLDYFATNTLNNEDTYSFSSIIIEDHEAPQLVSLLEELITNEPSTPVSNNHSNKLVQEAVAELKGNTFINQFHTPMLEEAKSSSTY